MKRIQYILGIIFAVLISNPCATFAQDTTFNRVVTVERDYQPEIEQAQMIHVTPSTLQVEVDPNPVVYSTYSTPLSIGMNLHPLQAAELQFTAPSQLNGIIDAAVGHRNTHLNFAYQLQEKKNWSIDLFAKHDAYWGKDSQSKSAVGIDVCRKFSNLDFFANASGNVMHWDYYKTMMDEDYGLVHIDLGNSILWDANANVGIKSTGNNAFQYRIQTGYSAVGQMFLAEHMVNTHIDAAWTNNTHTVGVKAYVKNNFFIETSGDLTVDDEYYSPSSKHSRHAIRVEPFYAYSHKNFHLHAGVNIDMNIDSFMDGENWLSKTDNLGFAPSPNVQVSWHSNNNLLHVYANATGRYGTATMDEKHMYNPYTYSIYETNYIAPYTPIDATVGIKLRPIKTMLLDIYGGYALRLSDYATYVDVDATNTAFNFISTTYSIGKQSYEQCKIGANLHYHYRDILEINVGGNYYFYHQRPISSVESNNELYNQIAKSNKYSGWITTAFDRPNWDAYARIEAHIDSKWSIYSDNYFAGSRQAIILPYTSATIRPTISLNIGGQYAINRWLSVYAEVNDYLNRKDEIFYGFKSQGIHFLVGAKYKF